MTFKETYNEATVKMIAGDDPEGALRKAIASFGENPNGPSVPQEGERIEGLRNRYPDVDFENGKINIETGRQESSARFNQPDCTSIAPSPSAPPSCISLDLI